MIARADGTCLYHLASVVDDYLFKITHVVRAVEHLPNTPRQIFIAQSLGYPLPIYAHLPYVAEPGGTAKLSKRKLDQYLKQKDFAALNEHGATIARKLQLATSKEAFNPVVTDFYQIDGILAVCHLELSVASRMVTRRFHGTLFIGTSDSSFLVGKSEQIARFVRSTKVSRVSNAMDERTGSEKESCNGSSIPAESWLG